MPQSSTTMVAIVLMFFAGIGIPMMATLNAGLGRGLGSPVAATAILYALALMLALIALAFTAAPARGAFAAVRWWFYSGAVFNVIYVLGITWAAPRIGVGNAVFLVLLGQLVATAVIDHYGLWGAIQTTLTPRRIAGIAVMGLGVWLAKRPG